MPACRPRAIRAHSSIPAAYSSLSRHWGSDWPFCGSRITGTTGTGLVRASQISRSSSADFPAPDVPAARPWRVPSRGTQQRIRASAPSANRPIRAMPSSPNPRPSHSRICVQRPGLQDGQVAAGLHAGRVRLGVRLGLRLVPRGGQGARLGDDLPDVRLRAVEEDRVLPAAGDLLERAEGTGPLAALGEPFPDGLIGPDVGLVLLLRGGGTPGVVTHPRHGERCPRDSEPARAPAGRTRRRSGRAATPG